MNTLEPAETETTGSLSEQAARWWVILHDENVSATEQREFAEWYRRSPERIAAWLHQTRLMGALRSGRVQWPDTSTADLIREHKAPGSDILQFSPHPPERETRARFHRQTGFGIAAAVMLIVVAGWVFLVGPQHYQTALGEQRSVVLPDGSLVTLNTASKITVAMHKDRRVIRLVEGEALFQVAHDAMRPFDVQAGATTLRAVGTQFNVDRRAASTTVTVIEGRVAVSPSSNEAASSSPSPEETMREGVETADARAVKSAHPQTLILSAAERVVITAAGTSHPRRIKNIAAATAWTTRKLIFDHRPLGEVAAEFNRYNRVQLRIDAPQLAEQSVTGVFQANDPESFLGFLSQLPGIGIQREDDGVHVMSARRGGQSQ